MKISLQWLQDYVAFTASPEVLAKRLTMMGLEVENIEHLGDVYTNFFVGEILQTKRHPNADTLRLCKVNVGKDVLNIVCGASNATAGQKVAIGLVGAVVLRSQHDEDGRRFVLERIQIRGETSEGMICSAYELNLGSNADEILVLEKNAKVGTPLAEYLGLTDVVFDVGVTPNRPDCLSHIGVAREVAAAFNKSVKYPVVRVKERGENIKKAVRVKIENTIGCPRYSARMVCGVNVEPSPKWMQERLNAVGIRSINNIVDITNYVLMEFGHPLHAFDFDKLQGHAIVVKHAHDGEQFITLDGVVRKLNDKSLLICDSVRPIAIAGIMGGVNTEVSEATRNVLIESAYFNPRSIRRTSKHLGLQTEASQRFARGADPNGTVLALNRVVQLIEKIAGGRISRGIIDHYPKKFTPKKVSLRVEKANAILGTHLMKRTVIQALSKLEIPLSRSSDTRRKNHVLSFEVPTFRPDIEGEIDLIEEIARVYGYDKIEPTLKWRIHFSETDIPRGFENELREYFVGGGYHEVIANSMEEKSIASLANPHFIEMINPISKDMAALRTSLVPGILNIIVYNIHRGIKDLRLFEIGKAYFIKDGSGKRGAHNYFEEDRLLLGLSGRVNPTNWSTAGRNVDIFDIKGELETLFSTIFLDKVNFIYYSNTKTLTDLTIGIEINRDYLGYLGRVNEQTLMRFELKQEVFVGEISLDVLRRNAKKKVLYEELPRYPTVLHDIAFVVDESQSVQELVEVIRESGRELVHNVELFDIYVGDKIGSGKKSCAFSVQFLSKDRTLTVQEVEKIIRQIVSVIGSRFGGQLRAF